MPISVTWLPLCDVRSSILYCNHITICAFLRWLINCYLGLITPFIIDFWILETNLKKLETKQQITKGKKKRTKGFKFIARSLAKVVILWHFCVFFCVFFCFFFSQSVFSRSVFSRSAFSRSVFSRSAVWGLRFRGLCFRDTHSNIVGMLFVLVSSTNLM